MAVEIKRKPAIEFDGKFIDPVKFTQTLWPDITLYDKQRAIMYSVVCNDETIVPAGNMLGKDFISALVVIYYFMTRHPCRVVTTSVDQSQLEKVLWGELLNFIYTAQHDLPLKVNHLDIKKKIGGVLDQKSYIIGRVCKTEEGLLGHHLARGPDKEPRTLMVYDEASGVEDGFKNKTDTWAHRTLVIGNPYPCENFFRRGAREGDLVRDSGIGYYRKIIQIKAQDSPNVQLGEIEISKGYKPTYTDLLPGVLSFADYQKRRKTFDAVLQSISLDAEFYEGGEYLLYPPTWLNRAAAIAAALDMKGGDRRGKSIGIDPAEGGNKTSMSCVDEYGLVDLVCTETKDTSEITGNAIAFWQKHGVSPKNVVFDQGGGGKQHADVLRRQGYPVRTVAFGEAATSPEKFKPGKRSMKSKAEEAEERYTYLNRRAEMYGILMLLLDPTHPVGFGIPARYTELRRQMALIPKIYDTEGRLKIPPKNKPSKESKIQTLIEILGCSPDELDSLVLAVFGRDVKPAKRHVGAF